MAFSVLDEGYSKRRGVLIGGAVAAVAILSVVVGSVSYSLRASLFQPDAGNTYHPLVRHQISQVHCYDDGSKLCESAVSIKGKPQPYTKEFTIGFLLDGKAPIDASLVKNLFLCVDPTQNRFPVGLSVQDCQQQGLRFTLPLGRVFVNPTVEAATPLYRCFNTGSKDELLTDDTSECILSGGYGQPQLLGYIAGAGHVPQRRLNEFCSVVKAQCTTGRASQLLCAAQQNFCKGPQ